MNKFLCLIFLFTASCSGSGNGDSKSEDYSASYDLTFNGCPTGKHEFSASSEEALLEKMCAALTDDELNNHCAYSLRAEKFNRECDGTEAQANL